MKYLAVIKDVSLQFGGETCIACATRADAVIRARAECTAGRAIGIECYARVLPAKRNGAARQEFERLGWL